MLEGQTFPEVFPDYTVPENLKYILSNAVVSKVVIGRTVFFECKN